eukprot:5421113-Lingulodinium_polyedra.AAC.1
MEQGPRTAHPDGDTRSAPDSQGSGLRPGVVAANGVREFGRWWRENGITNSEGLWHCVCSRADEIDA